MKTLLLNVQDGTVERLDIEPNLDSYYELIGCDCIDIAYRKIGGKYYDLVVDDEGLLKPDPKISAIDDMGSVMLVGNILFFNNDGMGDFVGLDEDDYEHLEKHIMHMSTRKYPLGYPMLVQC